MAITAKPPRQGKNENKTKSDLGKRQRKHGISREQRHPNHVSLWYIGHQLVSK